MDRKKYKYPLAARAAQSRYRQRHPEKVKKYLQEYEARNPERKKQRLREWREKNWWALKLSQHLGVGIREARRLIYESKDFWEGKYGERETKGGV